MRPYAIHSPEDFAGALRFAPRLKVSAAALRIHYLQWCEREYTVPVTWRRVADMLAAHGAEHYKSNGQRLWRGVDVVAFAATGEA